MLRLTFRLFITLCFVSVLLIAARAQSPDKVLKQAVKALTNGKGEKPLRAIKSWEMKGTIRDLSNGATGSYSAAATLPNLYTSTFDLNGIEVSAGFNGRSAWLRDSRQGLQTLTNQASRDFQTEAAYRNTRWLDAKRDKSKLTAAGQADVNGKPANVVLLTTAKNVKIKLYFDLASGLLVREEVPAAEINRTFDYSDYRLIDGVMEAHQIQITTGEQRLEVKLERITHNAPVDRAAFDFPKLSNEPLPDITALLKQVGENEEEIDRLLEKYTYTETVTQRELKGDGQLVEKESETFELTFYKGNRIRRQIAKNGKPLSASEEADENKKVEKRVRDVEKKEAEKEKKADKEREVAQSKGGTPDPDSGQRPTISDILRASRLVNPRRERLRGRDVIVFDFEPLPGYKPQKDFEKFFGKNVGAIWVDAADKQVARVEARLASDFNIGGGVLAKLREGASFVLEQDRINDEIWLPTRADINLGLRVLLVKGFNVNVNIVYGNYKRFNVEAEKERLKDPVKP